MKKISFIFPVYCEEGNIDKLNTEMSNVFEKLKGKYDYEVIFINDGSKDNSLEKLVELQQKNDKYSVINFSRNFGHQMAVTAGLDFSTGDAVIIMDSDLQDPPFIALELISKWEEGFEVVYAQRRTRQDTFFKKLTAHFFYRILDKLADIKIPKDTGDFRLMDRKVVDQLNAFREKNRYLRGLVSYVGFKQTGVLFDRSERFSGKTGYPLKKMIKFALDAITGFSTVPLKVITQFGFWISVLSFVGILYAIAVRVFFPQHTVEGTTFTVIAVLFIGGVQMIMLGILGTYIGRIYSEVQHRPLYVVSSVYSSKKKEITRK